MLEAGSDKIRPSVRRAMASSPWPKVARARHSLGSLAAVAALVATGSAAAPFGNHMTKAPAKAAPFTVADANPWGTTWSYSPYNSTFLGLAYGLSLLPLAMLKPPMLTSFMPELATSWAVKGHKLTVNLQPKARWQTGQRLTSKDVLATALLNGLNGSAMWQDVSSIATPSADKVVFTIVPSVPVATAEDNVLGMNIISNREYRKFLTPGLQHLVQSYSASLRANPTAAPNTSAGKTIANDESALVKFNPKKLIGDGPFVLKKATTSQAEFVKWNGFWNASKIHVPKVLWQEAENAETNAASLFGGRADYSWTAFSWPIYQRELNTPGMHIYTPSNYAQYAIYFNNAKYPLNLAPVRQALAYLIHRPSLDKLAYGGHSFNSYVKYPALLNIPVASKYLNSSQIRSLNPYNYNPAKATRLLDSAGFHKTSSGWKLPNGKPFTLSIDGPAGYDTEDVAIKVIANWLSSFGIKTSATAVEQPGYWTYQDQGNYDMDWGWGAGGLNPLTGMNNVIGPGLNFPDSGTYKGDKGLGFGPTMNVPGLGKVNIPETLNREASTIGPGPKMHKLLWAWAKFVNSQVPVLSYADKNIPIQFSTARYTDWPPKSSPLWTLMGYNIEGGLLAMMETGHIRPR